MSQTAQSVGWPAAGDGGSSWIPVPARIVSIKDENFNTKTFTLEFTDERLRWGYRFAPGQFNMVYVPHVGEAAISISSDPAQSQQMGHTIRLVGMVTRAMGRMKVGDIVGLRGPYGKGWPMERLEGHDVVIMAGGIGLAPLRPVVYWLLQHRKRCGRVVLFYGCRFPEDRLFCDELQTWETGGALDVPGDGGQCHVGLGRAGRGGDQAFAAREGDGRADDRAGLRAANPQSGRARGAFCNCTCQRRRCM